MGSPDDFKGITDLGKIIWWMGKGGEFHQALLEQNEYWTLSLLACLFFSTSFFHCASEGEREAGWKDVRDCLRGKEAGGIFWIAWEGRRLEGCLGLPEGEGGWRDVWDCLRGKEAGETFGMHLVWRCPDKLRCSLCSQQAASTFHIPSPSCSRLLGGIARLKGSIPNLSWMTFFPDSALRRCPMFIPHEAGSELSTCPGCRDQSLRPVPGSTLCHPACPLWNTNDRN